MKKSAQEIVRRTRGRDTLRFGAGIAPESLEMWFFDPVRYPTSAMVIKYGTDQINISQESIGTLQHYEFNDGRSFDLAGLMGLGVLHSPLVGNESMRRRIRAAIINGGKAANDEATQAWRVAA